MSTRAELREYLGEQTVRDPATVCSICGEPIWTAAWVGMIELHLCRRCAVEVLPRIIADAIGQPHLTLAEITDTLTQIKGEFWRACALRLLREREHA